MFNCTCRGVPQIRRAEAFCTSCSRLIAPSVSPTGGHECIIRAVRCDVFNLSHTQVDTLIVFAYTEIHCFLNLTIKLVRGIHAIQCTVYNVSKIKSAL